MRYRDILRARLKADEGVKAKPYRDTEGKLTVGVGHNLDDKPLPPQVIDLLLDTDIDDAERDARSLLANFDGLSDVRKVVVVSMSFNLGRKRLASFVSTLLAINEGRWEDAATSMLQSKWAGQVKGRADRLALMMHTDQAL